MTNTYAYSPYGELEEEEGYTAEGTPFLYQDDYLDAATDLYHMQARWYDPTTALFTSMDPAMGDATDPMLRMPYMYSGGDPVYNADPTGKCYMGDEGSSALGDPFAYYVLYVLGYDSMASYYIDVYGFKNVSKGNFPRGKAKSLQSAIAPAVTLASPELAIDPSGATLLIMSSELAYDQGEAGLRDLLLPWDKLIPVVNVEEDTILLVGLSRDDWLNIDKWASEMEFYKLGSYNQPQISAIHMHVIAGDLISGIGSIASGLFAPVVVVGGEAY